jgi:hypothetical protein
MDVSAVGGLGEGRLDWRETDQTQGMMRVSHPNREWIHASLVLPAGDMSRVAKLVYVDRFVYN